jgi:MOSC domain-containing protein YiiM
VNAPQIASIHVGKIAPLGSEGVLSGFVKHAVAGPVRVTPLGILGDEQADPSVHGGPEKAVYGYATSHYTAWRREYPQHSLLLVPGGFGENLAFDGLSESDLCVGDIHGIGSAQLQVCQPRQPCFKFALRHTDKRLPKAMVRLGFSGWYYRVLKTGQLKAGDALILHARPNPDFSFARLTEIVYHGNATRGELYRMANMQELAGQWRDTACQLLE